MLTTAMITTMNDNITNPRYGVWTIFFRLVEWSSRQLITITAFSSPHHVIRLPMRRRGWFPDGNSMTEWSYKGGAEKTATMD